MRVMRLCAGPRKHQPWSPCAGPRINPGALAKDSHKHRTWSPPQCPVSIRLVQDPVSINPYARVHAQAPSYNPIGKRSDRRKRQVTTQMANGWNGGEPNCNKLATNTKRAPVQEPLRKTPRARPLAQDPVRRNPFLNRCPETCDMCCEACCVSY
jgi:hypothetical protein